MAGPYEIHLFNCLNDEACTRDGPAVEMHAWLKRQIKREGLAGRVRANRAGCFNQCGHGPMMVIYPEGVWYAHLDLAAVGRIWQEHVLGGRPVAEFVYEPPSPGTNKLPRTGEPDDRVDWQAVGSRRCGRCPPD
jgi:(2Fe-2S) ferredoxin